MAAGEASSLSPVLEHSDSDDWTLVSRPGARRQAAEASGLTDATSQASQQAAELGLDSEPLQGDSDELDDDDDRNQPVEYGDGCCTEIDLGRPASAVPGFQPLESSCSSGDEADESSPASSRAQDSRRSSLTQSELGDYVDLGKQLGLVASELGGSGSPAPSSDDPASGDGVVSTSSNTHRDESQKQCQLGEPAQGLRVNTAHNQLLSSQTPNADQQLVAAAGAPTPTTSRATQVSVTRAGRHVQLSASSGQLPLKNWLVLHVVVLAIHVGLNHLILPEGPAATGAQSKGAHTSGGKAHVNSADSARLAGPAITIPASSHEQVSELRRLHEDLSQCIRRQSPTSFKYYMSEERQSQHFVQARTSAGEASRQQSGSRGLVCYGQEMMWRKRIDKLKLEHNLDLRQLVGDARRRLANEMLLMAAAGSKPGQAGLQLELILNQLEYLDFLERKREKKQSEETIRHLRAENMQLLRKLQEPNDAASYQRMAVRLELDNNRLRRDSDALKASLLQKAGPAYMKQALELEAMALENQLLKQFHQQVAQEVSRGMKQFKLYTIDSFKSLHDHETLRAQLSLTRGHLQRFGERVGALLIENEALKVQLRDSPWQPSTTTVASAGGRTSAQPQPSGLETVCSQALASEQAAGSGGGLLAESCARKLSELEVKYAALAAELERTQKRLASREAASASDQQLAELGNRSVSVSGVSSALAWPGNELTEHLGEPGQDELLMFLANFATSEQRDDSQALARQHAAKPAAKIIPNYIRDAVRSSKSQPGPLERAPAGGHVLVPHINLDALASGASSRKAAGRPDAGRLYAQPANCSAPAGSEPAPASRAQQADGLIKRAKLRDRLRQLTARAQRRLAKRRRASDAPPEKGRRRVEAPHRKSAPHAKHLRGKHHNHNHNARQAPKHRRATRDEL